jgi:hypothetical protein
LFLSLFGWNGNLFNLARITSDLKIWNFFFEKFEVENSSGGNLNRKVFTTFFWRFFK